MCQPNHYQLCQPKERNSAWIGITVLGLVILFLALVVFALSWIYLVTVNAPATVTLAPTPVLVPTMTPVQTRALVLTTANVRAGASVAYPVVRTALSGSVVEIVGCNADCSWYKTTAGWICANLVRVIVGSVGQ